MRLRSGRYISGHLRHGVGRAAILGTGLLVASVSATLLTAAVGTNAARVQGTVVENFRTSYDLLVRPPGTQTPLEVEQGLVRNNVESGIYGGISRQQWQSILDVPGVEVAAPVQYVGYVLASVPRQQQLREVRARPGQLYRIREVGVADAGLSRYPGPVSYYYRARRGESCSARSISGPNDGSPFALTSPGAGDLTCVAASEAGPLMVGSGASIPLLVAAVDPEQENALLGLDEAMTSGTALTESTTSTKTRLGVRVPVIAADSTFLDQSVDVSVELVDVPPGEDVAARLRDVDVAAGTLPSHPNDAWRWVHRLPSEPVAHTTIAARAWYSEFLRVGREGGDFGFFVPFLSYMAAGNPEYSVAPDGTLLPVKVPADDSVWLGQRAVGVPQANRDIGFRPLTPHNAALDSLGAGQSEVEVVGEFDPGLLPGFDELNRVPLETYFPPEVSAGDDAAREAMAGDVMRPSWNVAGYVATPPALLTTLDAARSLTAPRFFPTAQTDAQISVVRVKVDGVTGVDDESLQRIEAVASRIAEETGLVVDVTAGSSPAPQSVVLPAGKFGRPELALTEGWAKKGVALVILSAVDNKSVALLGLVLLTTVGYLGNAALAAVRTRRREIATLAALGWSQRSIFFAVLGELALIGLIAGACGAVVAALIVDLFDLDFPLGRVAAIPLVAVILTTLAGAIPARNAARSNPIDAIRPVVAGRTKARATRRLVALAWTNLRRVPGRSLIAAAGLALGVGALNVLLAVNQAFQGTVSGTLLGDFVSVQVRGVDFVAVAFTIAMAGMSVADVLVLNARERAGETATLQAVGWSDRHIGALIMWEACLLGGGASLTGALIGSGVGALLGIPTGDLLVVAVVSAAVGLGVAVLAAVVPTWLVTRAQPAHNMAWSDA